MAGLQGARVAVVVARTVDRFVGRFNFSALDEARRIEALGEIAELRASLGHNSALIDSAFAKLERALRHRGKSGVRPSPLAARKLARMLRALTPLAMVGAGLSTFVATPAMAALASYDVGDTIFNPLLGATGTNETVLEVIGSPGYAVRTQTSVIILARAVGDSYTVAGSGGTSTTFKVTAVHTTTVDGTDYVTSVDVKDADDNASTQSIYNSYSAPPVSPDGTDGSGTISVNVPPPSGNEQYSDVRAGARGGDGDDGYGIEVCVPFTDICGIIGVGPSRGGNGANGPDFAVTIPSNWSGTAITNTAASLPGIKVASVGGNGGQGGDAYGNFDGEAGGTAGNGGAVTATNYSDVSTGGANSYGMWVFSQAGSGGSGGSGYIFGGGGSGGGAAAGGTAHGINNADISTQGTGAVGLLVQSLGGGGGSGGSSYGVVGSAGSGSIGGNGGTAIAENNGNIVTHGDFAFGVQAQSIGGNGGNSGNGVGIVAFTGTGGGAGNGSTASVVLGSTSGIETFGKWAHGAVAQSIGGGGGAAGWTGGIAVFGGNGGSGGVGGTASVTAAAGSYIETHGIGSYGIYAESVGGTGGTASGSGGAFTMGGSGGSGNVGGTVSVNSSATIVTHAQDARGIFAQSVGGGGGSANTSGGVVTLGGSGGSGANGGQVTVTLGSASDIATAGKGADGVFAQSVGGGGGSGASAVGIVALGGKGSVGGTGGTVTVTNGGSITTDGRLARGLFAQSVGGGGGSGGDGGALVAIGGASSSGGNGGTVTLGNSGTIDTDGAFSQGMFAQSIGGGGGSGGDAGGLAAIGGSGDGGGTGGNVTLSNSGLVTTGGNMSSAIQAQSIGGGGGDGGSTGGVLVTIGGTGGLGNNAGTVTANISGGMQTTGDDSHGLFAQAVGGGGGNGGSSVSVSAFAGVAIGGSGGAGGAGGTVDVNLSSQTVDIGGVETEVLPQIITSGDRSRGIFAQSVGGGGGSGGYAVQASAGAFFSASVAIGGSGGSGSQGGTVTLDGDTNVFTSGDNSQGIFAQSVGGGGGAGGFSVAATASAGEGFSGSIAVGIGGDGGSGGYGGSVTGDSGGNIVTKGRYSTGYLAQSVGGGGGAGGFSVAASGAVSDGLTVSAAIGIGGDGGGGGNGGTVDVAFDGNIATGDTDGSGSDSAGFIAQSVGGGGGTGGFNVSATLGFSGGGSLGGSVGLGGWGGGGGNGGTVTGEVGSVTTTGARSTGVLIQSLGGGGGSGGFNVSGSLTGSGGYGGGISVGLGGSGAGGGTGGTVTGTVTGITRTSGDQSDAVIIQSLGGGGGSGAFNVSGNIGIGASAAGGISIGLGGSGGTGGDGGSVTGHVQDNVITTGEQSRGVLVQSTGGGGGGGAFNVSGNLEFSGSASGSIGVGLGGSGGGGGAGGTVIADAKSISTLGNDSAGFIAQSVGGGGGAGGFNVTGGLAFSGTASGSIGVGLGGSGGGGGSASTVDATVVGNVVTQGDRSGAILAQSVGGGGGSGGFNVSGDIAAAGTGAASVSVGLGGSGGTAGNALGVTLDVTGAAQTGAGTAEGEDGEFSDGIVAQSIGGGGGNGGFNVTGNIAAAGTGAGQVGVGIGGHGGRGGSAGTVTLNVNDGATLSDATRLASITRQDHSAGIIAQSVGGGGGNGGFNVTGGMSFGGTGAGGVNVGIGGSGGSGNSASTVTADISGLVQTYGSDSLGILAQSVGGGGGNGGFDVAGGLTFATDGSGSINVGIGGSGGSGGTAGAVTLNVNDQVAAPTVDLVAASTGGDRSAGIVAQSLGGGGGNGGFNVTGGINASGGFTGGANIGIGGMGGSGGAASAVTADITGAIGTGGNQSGALLLQSVGGGGGNGAFNVTGGLVIAKDGGGQIGVGVGGFGGDGGSGGNVTLALNDRTDDAANILVAASTLGEDSDAVIVQSLGGGGGNGGFNVTGSLSLTGGSSGSIGVGVGGFGGEGGSAGTVLADMAGDILTSGTNSNALLVQSAGGGGGNGGFNVTGGISLNKSASGNIGVGIGGFGGSGGSGNTVTSTLSGDVTTLANSSTGVTVQSLGGGGGNGGFNVTGLVSVAASSSASGNIGVGLGGFGGDGGSAGSASSTIAGDIFTRGSDSYALLVQSQGGGGGNGGFNVTGNLAVSTQGSAGNLGIGIGGFGGHGGDAGNVTSALTGDIVTGAADQNGVLLDADRSSGATIQSVGGGGGNGGFNVTGNISATMGATASGDLGVGVGGFGGDGGNAGTVTATQTGDIVTRGDGSYGLLVQSAGGGGGNGGFDVTGNLSVSKGSSGTLGVGIGGFGGGGGAGNTVSSTLTGDVTTLEDSSSGITVQSLGGGGGNGGFNVTGGISVSASSSASGNIGVGLGGFGGDGGSGGAASSIISGDVFTRGSDSYGLLVQSQGGGGGNGAFNVTGTLAVSTQGTAGNLGVGIGGFGGDGGDAGNVTSTLSGDIVTGAADQNGLLLAANRSSGATIQSVGGGGGNGGFNVTGNISVTMGAASSGDLGVGVGGFGGGGGNAGTVTATGTGDIITRGEDSYALLVQSAGGGGGSGGFDVTGNLSVSKGGSGTLGVGIGGFGGSGGTGDTASSTLTGDVTTLADASSGVTVQSLGGGGGNGGFNVTGEVSVSASSSASGNIGVGLGGFGGDGGSAGNASSTITGDIFTRGSESYGLLVQSQGGGGGNGGFNVTGALAVSTQGSAGNLGIGIGGFGGDGGSAGNVISAMTGDIVTGAADQAGALLDSYKSSGATIQSVGGGGGNGGFNVTGNLSVTMGTGTSGDIGLGLGGFGGDGGDAGTVTATQSGDVTTRGDESYGILVQSAGGGGGNGGFDVTGNIAIAKGSSGTVGIGVGGFGGSGGTGNAVIATLLGDVLTSGNDAFGATIQSLGGGGGNGGMNVTGDMTISAGNGTSIAASIGLGGFGGDGGDAGSVTGSATGLYQTSGNNSGGILVQSAGGGGGAGGLDVSGSIAVSSGTAGSGSVGIGGFGGGGGDGSTVVFTRTGDTFTDGANSNGVTIQSVGGGGGAGGINVSGGIAATKGNAGSVGFGLGGFGGDGGNGGDVTAAVYGNVLATGLESDTTTPVFDLSLLEGTETEEDYSDLVVGEQRLRTGGSTGVLVQSVGGGGGTGGLNVTGTLAVTTGSTSSTGRVASIGIGGFGGAGGNAGNVTATVAAEAGATERVQVQGIGDSQMAFAAQSIGGGGGAGGINVSGGISTAGQLVVGIGGFGGAGGTAGDVDANVDADLFVAGNNSIGFLAQSVGGGGGAGAINISGGIQAATKGKEPEVVFGLGGFGGAGNIAGNVTAVQHGQVMAEGLFSYGVLAQSIGGGGGAGGLNVSAAVTGAGNAARKTEGIAISAGVGGNGGTGANAGNVSLTSDGNIFVNTVIATNAEGELEFSGVDGAIFAPGVVAQSIGGGGGAGGMNVTGSFAPKGVPIAVGVGGTGGVGGDAGNVSLTRGYGEDGPGLIITYGQGSHGLVAQSIGGGGGNAGFNLVLAANKSKPKNPQYGATVTVGGDGGSSGDAGNVTVEHLGDIYTEGSGSDGILAQSISGGGGSGAMNVTGALMKDSSVVSLAIGGRGGDGGNAGSVSVAHDGIIVTDGANSAAIRAQSIGSGGGDVSAEEDLTAFFDDEWPVDVAIPIGPKNEISVGIGDVGGKGGVAGDVAVDAAGTLITQGVDAAGIHAQSIGGSGGASGTTSVGASGENRTGSQGGGVSVSVGLEGGEGGVAGKVSVTSSAVVGTTGDRSRGIFAQSIGGSGGSGGEASNNIENASNEMHISVGGPGGSGSQAGNVDVTQTGRIDTLGNDADGILAQSIGGGGGAGGASGTQNLQYMAADSNTLAIAVGGSGGNGAIAGDVTVTNGGIITTSGDKSFGIRAQSIGGGGGVGGAIDSKKMLITGTSNSIEFNVGGSGGEGSSAGDVSVLNEGLIWTTGLDAAAISANSIGGGGGDAGSILDLSVSAATSNTFKANIGGTGGSGAVAGDVTVVNRPTDAENSGYLITEGDGAYGIFAQSLGGSGGNSSTILSISVDGGAGSISAGFNFGNAGGTGNLAGDVSVDNGGIIDTSGEGAHGILAQSIGGGGGNGGIVLSGNLNLTMPVAAPLLSIGGSGGDGGDAGNVDVVNSGSIVTRGNGANGIVAQSIGGGGGNAGVALAATGEPGSLIIGNALAAALGATTMTGSGGEGGSVTVTHTGDITVLGEGSQAIVAQSINGGGGMLTLDFDQVAAMFEDDGSSSAAAPDPLVAARSGSTDSSGMAGGNVTVNSTGTIGVGGAGGVAINLQSIGGGGGTIVLHGSLVAPISPVTTMAALALAPSAAEQTAVGYDISLGGVNGAGNSGGDIAGSQEGEIVTESDNSLGLMVQSIGGGGGRAIATLEAEDLALLAGSTINVGGTGQSDSAGGDISHIQDGTLFSIGDFSIGGLVQSVGGGGGVATITYGHPETDALAASNMSASDAAGVQHLAVVGAESLSALSTATLGASGGTGNDGGAVSETLTGGAVAAGDHSTAIILQSIGAGGGVVTLSGDSLPQISLGGGGGAQGSGGDISFANVGAIAATGLGGYAVILQSIGGGGGAIFGDFVDADVSLSSDNIGDGGAIAFAQSDDITALGDHSIGILAQSLGGGGGFVEGQFAGTAGGIGSGGAVSLNVDGSIIAYGAESTAVLAQSLGSLGGGDISLLSSGDIRGGSGIGIGVNFDGGADNLIDTSGTLSAVSGLAIKTTYGNDTVENRGLIVGNAVLGEGTNLVHNNEGATYITIDTLDLQDGSGGGAFVNDGDVELGLRAPRFPIDLAAGETFDVPTYDNILTATLYGTEVISQVALDGDYSQSATGEIWFDIAFGPYASDRIDATGDATVDGTGYITLTWLENDDPVTLIATGGTGTDLGMDVPGTIALDYHILAGSEGIQLAFDSDFGQSFLNDNEQQLGHHMDSALEVGGASGIGRLMALLGNLSEGQEDVYQAIFDELDPESLLAPTVENLDSARDFSKRVMGCDPIAKPKLDKCLWGRIDYHELNRDGGDNYPIDLDGTARLRIGGAIGLQGGWSLGGAFGYDSLGKLTVDSDRALGDDGEAFHVGVGVGKAFGADGRGSAGVNLAAGWQDVTMERRQDVFEPLLGTSRIRSHYLAANANVGYSFGTGPWFVRPNVDASAIRLTLKGFDEQGLEGLGMSGDRSSDWFLSIEPKATVGAKLDKVHFSLTGGAMFSNRESIRAPMRFIGSDSASDPALIRTMVDDQAFVAGAELGVDASQRLDLSVGYQGYWGSQIKSHAANLSLRYWF